MAKKLTIIRHAKSDWGSGALRDFDRPLNNRGLRDAPFMAKAFSSRVSEPVSIISSPAMRAKTTALEFARSLNISENQIQFKEEVYHAHHDMLLDVINSLSDDIQHAIIFGHNPGLSDLATLLSNDVFNLPTCAIVELEFEIESWSMMSLGIGSIVNYDFPKKHLELQ